MAKRTASAKKQARAGARRTVRNRAVKSEIKTMVVKARKSLVAGPVAESERHAIALEAVRALDRAAAKGIIHRNNAARRKGRIMQQLVKVAGAQAPAPKRGAKAAAKPAPKPAPRKAPAKKK